MSGFEAWAVKALAAGGLVLLAGYLLAKACRGPARRQAAVAWAVRGAVVAAVVAALPGWLPVTLPVPPSTPPPPAEAVAAATEVPLVWEWVESAADEFVAEPLAADEPIPAELPSNVTPSAAWPVERWLAVGYALGAAGFGLRLLLGHLALARLTRTASPAPPRVKQRFPGRVFVADRVQSPVCFGVLRPTVLLPRGLAETASAGELDWVLAHEADHLRRGDHRSTWLAAVAGCVFFPLPWFWAVRRELVLAQEFLADAAAAGDRPADYAAYLVHLSASPARLPQLAAGVRAGRSDLSRRVTMLLNERTQPRRTSRRWRLMVGAGTLAGAVVLGGLTVQQAAADEPTKPLTVEVAIGEPKVETALTVEVVLDDEKKPAGDKDKPKATEEKKRVIIQAKPSPEVAKLKEQIKAAAKKGNDEEVAELVEKLEKVLRAAPKVMTLEGKELPGGNFRVFPDGKGPMQFKFEAHGIDEAIKQLQQQLDSLGKDVNPQAKEAMEQALKSLKGMQGQGGFKWQGVPGPADPFAQKPRFGAALGEVPADVREQLDLGENVGVQVAEVRDDTAAAKAGLKKGDVIVTFAGKDVAADPTKFTEQVRTAKAGEVKVVVLRKGKKQALTVELPEAPKGPDADAIKRKVEDTKRRVEDQAKRAEDMAKRAAEMARERATRDRERAGREKAEAGEKRAESRSVSVTVNDGKFTITASGGGTESRLSGTIEDGKPAVESVSVKDGGETFKGKSIGDVPEKYRAELKKLLGNISVKQ